MATCLATADDERVFLADFVTDKAPEKYRIVKIPTTNKIDFFMVDSFFVNCLLIVC